MNPHRPAASTAQTKDSGSRSGCGTVLNPCLQHRGLVPLLATQEKCTASANVPIAPLIPAAR